MNVRIALRAAAVVIALLALLNPQLLRERSEPLAIHVQPSSASLGHAVVETAREVRRRIQTALGEQVRFDSPERHDAVVLVGDTVEEKELPDGVPISTVSTGIGRSPNVRIAAVHHPRVSLTGWTTPIEVRVDARGMSGASTTVVLEQHGIELDRVEHRWSEDEEALTAVLTYAPSSAGPAVLRVTARPDARETTDSDNAFDLLLDVEARKLRVLTFEPRPSWAASFVRRALEGDPLFDVAAVVRTSRGLEVRGGTPPARLTASALESFDAVLIGAPEDLTSRDVDALDQFVRKRGGTVVFIPDRAPSGTYTRLIPADGFDEALLESPASLQTPTPLRLKASELAVPRRPGVGGTALAELVENGAVRPVIVSWPSGAGHVIFSGAMDAWRYRDGDGAFTQLWRAQIAARAAAAPRRLELSLATNVVRPGRAVKAEVRLRGTEIAERDENLQMPPLAAALVDSAGEAIPFRLWPTAEPGRYEGLVTPAGTGMFEVRASVPDGPAATRRLIVDGGASELFSPDSEALRLIAEATGGVAVSAEDVGPLLEWLRTLPGGRREHPVRPMESPWWAAAFAALLSAEWALRRLRGLR